VKIPKINFSRKNLPFIIISLVLIIVIIIAIYFFYQYQKTKRLLQNPVELAQEQAKPIIAKINKLILLPKGELPTLATVTDRNKLISQPFFAQVEDGDKLLIYPNAKKAILYRPSINKIIEVGPINSISNITSTSAELQKDPSTIITKNKTVALYNNTDVADLSSITEKELIKAIPDLKVIQSGKTINQYKENLVIDLKGNSQAMVEQIAQIVSAKVSTLPVGEPVPEADFIVILGQ